MKHNCGCSFIRTSIYPPVAFKEFDVDDFYRQLQPILVIEVDAINSIEKELEEELNRYKNAPIQNVYFTDKNGIRQFNNPLDWWRQNESKYPNVARLANIRRCTILNVDHQRVTDPFMTRCIR